MPPFTLRPATLADLPAINGIYNHYVQTSTATYQELPTTPDERLAWFQDHGPRHPVIVAEAAETILAWGSLSRFHARAAYRFTVEDSVYVHHAHHRQGLGRALLAELLTRAADLGHRSMIAVISADQSPSLALHVAFGFSEAGRLHSVGHKFDRWLDVVYLERLLP